MKSRKVGVDKKHKRNATKRKRASNIRKSKKKKLNKSKRRTRRRSRRQRGGNADYVVVVIGTHGAHCTISDGVMDQQRVPTGMNIRKINAAPLGLVNMTTYNKNYADTELVEGTVQAVLNDCKDSCDLSSASYDLASKLKQTDRYTQNLHILEGPIMLSKDNKRNLEDMILHGEYDHGHENNLDALEDAQKDIDESKTFMNKTDQRFQIEIINDDHPIYYDKVYSRVSDKDIMLFEVNKEAVNITNDVLGRLQTRNWNNLKESKIFKYLESIGKYNVIIVDLSCSVLDIEKGFSDRDIRHLNWKMKQEGILHPNPYKKEWQKKRQRGDFKPDENVYHKKLQMISEQN